MRSRNTDIAILVFVVVACAIPFLGQPFHMDDGMYMDFSRNVPNNPAFPNDFPYMFQGEAWPDMGSHSHPPFMSYFLAAFRHFFGEGLGKEWIYHTSALIFPLLAVMSFYWICVRFVQRPLWPAMLLACSPLLLVMQHTIMTDVPLLAFWLAAICCCLWFSDSRRKSLLVLSVFFQLCAVFISYQAMALAPLLGFYHLRRERSARSIAGLWSLAIAPAALIVWYFINYLHYDRPLWTTTLDYMQSRNPLTLEVLGTKLIAILEYHGWLIIFPFFLLYLLARALRWRALILVILAAAFVAQFRVPEYRFSDKTIFVVGLATGFFVVLEMGKLAWKSFFAGKGALGFSQTDGQFFALWYFGYFAYCLFFLTEGSARYILPLLPPIILLFFRVMETAEIPEYRLPRRFIRTAMLASGSLVVSLAWGLALSMADYEFAKVYPRAAADISRIAGGAEVYSVGEWGFRYYLARAGAPPLPADVSSVRGGSFLSVPSLAQPNNVPADLSSMMMPAGALTYRTKTPLRTMDRQVPAGFYSTGWGLIPFSFSTDPIEEIKLFQPSFMVERLPEASVETESGIAPWPGKAAFGGEPARLAVLAKPGTTIRYSLDCGKSRLALHCGISPESYRDGSNESFEFEIRRLDRDGRIMAERRLTLRPGVRSEDRNWQPVELDLKAAPGGIVEFRFRRDGGAAGGTGVFAESFIWPVE